MRQRREVVSSARRELKYLEDLSQKRKKCLSKKSTITGRSDPKLWKRKEKIDPEARENVKKQSVEDELNDLLINDDFALGFHSDSDLSEGDDEEDQEFYPNRV